MQIGKIFIRVIFLLLVVGCVSSCTTVDAFTGEQKTSDATKGAGIGALTGAAIGAIAGGGQAALIGAGIGALTGGLVGDYMDRQEAKLRKQLQGTGVSVTRSGDNLILNMPGDITFASGQSSIKSNFYEVLNSVVIVLNEFEKTYVYIVGYTDSVGSMEDNMELSRKRAESVAAYFRSRQIVAARVVANGKGPHSPVATNDTPEGRARNRRVTLTLVPYVE